MKNESIIRRLHCNTETTTNLSSYSHSQRIVLQSGDSEGVVLVTIVDDALPELGESFCISLILPEGNVEIGDTPEGGLNHLLCV